MEKKYFTEIVINKEKLSDGSDIFVAHCSSLGLASQGKNTEEAMKNIKEAINLYLEEQPERYENLQNKEPLFSIIEVSKSAKATNSIRHRSD
ncbi:type II toxin-antitoxin system HicB family antitoxin [Candidatus Woesearchaeota archaeon]|nr:type II toxin-antitoxin system HicB family antitoxin [Candidatus Woesearchaeota archaeon]